MRSQNARWPMALPPEAKRFRRHYIGKCYASAVTNKAMSTVRHLRFGDRASCELLPAIG